MSFLFLNSKIDQIMNVHHDNYNTFTKLQMDNKQNDNTTTLPSAPVSSIRVSVLVSTDDLSLVELVEWKEEFPAEQSGQEDHYILYRIHGRQIWYRRKCFTNKYVTMTRTGSSYTQVVNTTLAQHFLRSYLRINKVVQ